MKRNNIFLLAIILILLSITFFPKSTFYGQNVYADEGSSYYLHEGSYVDTINATHPGALPCIGSPKILVFYTEFTDGSQNWDMTKEEVENFFFSEYGKSHPECAYGELDSLRSFYYRSSYGKVDITGTVYEYKTKNSTSFYTSFYYILNEIIDEYKDSINWDEYDTNNDGYIDGIYVIARTKHSWGGPNFVGNYSFEVENKRISQACFLDSYELSTSAHETCHMFGPPDMYSGVLVNPAGIMSECIMDGVYGDIVSPTKFVLGWLDNVKFVSSSNIQELDLRSYSNYGDALIIYPNGDINNRNWFFVEYVTKEGNNIEYNFPLGLRIFRTQMNLYDNYDVYGTHEGNVSLLPSPYNYLEAIHIENTKNYFVQVGDEITPYTSPSTLYSDKFFLDGNSKYLDDLMFSGINIKFDKVEDGVAKIKVKIDDEIDDTKTFDATFKFFDPSTSSMYIDGNNFIDFASLESTIELKNIDSLKIKSKSLNLELDLIVRISPDKKTLYIGANNETFKYLRLINDWEINFAEINSYFGSKINIINNVEKLDFASFPISYSASGITYDSYIYNYDYDATHVYRISDNLIYVLCFTNDYKLSLSEVNILNNIVTNHFLEIPDYVEEILDYSIAYSMASFYENSLLYVKIGKYILTYQDFKLVDCYTLPFEYTTYLGGYGSHFLYDYSSGYLNIYELKIIDNSFYFNNIKIDGYGGVYIQPGYLNHIYSFVDNQLVICLDNAIKFIDVNRGVTFDFICPIDDSLATPKIVKAHVYFKNGLYYIFSSSNNLDLYIYDTDFNLVSTKTILNNMSSTIWGIRSLNIIDEEDYLLLYFNSPSERNIRSFSCTYLLKLNNDFDVVSFYKYGNSSSRFECHFSPISNNKCILLSSNGFSTICIECNNHDYDDFEVITDSTCFNSGIKSRICKNCGFEETVEIKQKTHIISEWIVGSSPTCYSPGYEYRTCTICSNILESRYTDIVDHEAIEVIIENETESSCTSKGEYDEVKYCVYCGLELSRENKIKDLLPHTIIEYLETIPPTCISLGEAVGSCIYCDYSEIITLPFIEHSYSDEYTIDLDSTCTSLGSKSKHCIYCGNKTDVVIIDLKDHKNSEIFIENQIPSTCTSFGSYDNVVYCIICKTELSREQITTPLLNHNYLNFEIILNPTCTNDGLKTYYCTECDSTKNEIISSLGHSYSVDFIVDIEATCESVGEKSHHCINCNERKDITEIPLTPHNFGDYSVINEPTCVDEGLMERTCKDCKIVQTTLVKALGHKYSLVYTIDIEATCENVGEKSHHCINCNERKDITEIPLKNHTYGNYIIINNPTCTSDGLKSRSCSVCGNIDSLTIKSKGHKYSLVYTIDIEATCESAGEKSRHCENCSDRIDITIIEKLSHVKSAELIENEVPPTCTNAGKYDLVIRCTICNIVLETNTIIENIIDHEFSEWTVTINPTIMSNGERVRTCIHCGFEEKEELEKLEEDESFTEIVESINLENDSFESLYEKLHSAYIAYNNIINKDKVSMAYSKYLEYLEYYNNIVNNINLEYEVSKEIENKYFISIFISINLISLLCLLISSKRWIL